MIDEINQQDSIAIVGGGITGIAAAFELAKDGQFQVTILEKESQPGGLSSYYQWQEVVCDRFYHVILSTDTNLIEFIKELNLESELFWREAKSGFYGERKLVSFSSVKDFLRFPFLSIWQKFRLGLGLLYISQLRDSSRLDGIYVQRWLTKVFGRHVYENIWEPLLRSKLGNAKERTSASFIWATITRLFGAQSFGRKGVKMGHVRGGYHAILSAAKRRLSELSVEVITNSPVLKMKYENNDNFQEGSRDASSFDSNHRSKQIVLKTNSGNLKFDRVLFTVPCPEVLQILNINNNNLYWQQLQNVEYLGVVCVLLILKRKLSPYYVINLLDKDIPFTGVIEATNIISTQDIGRKNLVYLPKYMSNNDPIYNFADDEIINLFVDNLKRIFPELKREEILHKNVFREKYVQPVQELNFLNRTTGFRTPFPKVYLANNSMIYNSTLNNNAATQLAREAVAAIITDFKRMHSES